MMLIVLPAENNQATPESSIPCSEDLACRPGRNDGLPVII